MARYIDAEEFLDLFYVAAFKQDKLFVKTVEMVVDDTPTAEVEEVKHGHFVRNERNIPKMKEFHEKGFALSMNTKSIFWTCSCCGSWASLTQKYCSECGAKMDGGNAR